MTTTLNTEAKPASPQAAARAISLYAVKFLTQGSRVYSGRNLLASSDQEAIALSRALYANGKIGVRYEVWSDTVLVHTEGRSN